LPRHDWAAWLVGIALLTAVVTAAFHLAEEESFLRLLLGLKPALLAMAIALQCATYLPR